jgi:1-acyl-sn-glycerol-3-phosphate acyltransferase
MQKMGWAARAFEALIVKWYRMQGWTVVGEVPEPRRFVLIATPHTSNWDFLYFIGGTRELGISPSFMGKKQMFPWPFTNMIKQMGGIPVDRSKSTNVVDAMIAEFATRDEFMLTIAPEGTRGKVREWKSGFYHIAVGAGVPLVIGMMDYAKKTVGLGAAIWPSGDYAADMAKVAEFYRGCTPKYPALGNAGLIAEADGSR